MNTIQYAHAAAVCARLETGLIAAANRVQHAITEAQAELQKMLDTLNDGRVARGLPRLDVQFAHLDSGNALPYEDPDLPETWGDVDVRYLGDR